jgi:hypothetical protein
MSLTFFGRFFDSKTVCSNNLHTLDDLKQGISETNLSMSMNETSVRESLHDI